MLKTRQTIVNSFLAFITLGIPLVSDASESTFSASLIIDSSFFSSTQLPKRSVTRGLFDMGYKYKKESWTFFGSIQAQRGDSGSDPLGDIQIFSNIDENDFEKLYELWGEYQFVDYSTRLKIGQMDMNNEFAFADNAGEFINSSMGFSPTIFVLPTYPSPAIGAVISTQLTDHSEFSFGLSAGQNNDDFSDRFFIGEWRHNYPNGILKVGVWHHDGYFERLNQSELLSGASGVYAIVNGKLSTPDFGYFLQFGSAEQSVSEIKRHFGAGLVRNLSKNPEVMGGVGVSTVWLSDYMFTENQRETAWELFLRIDFTEHFSIKPDVQYIASPSGENRNELVATIRLEFSL